MSDWRNCDPNQYPWAGKLVAERCGANAGLALGVPVGDVHAVAYDFDPAEGHEELWPVITEAVAYNLGTGEDTWVHKSRPGSAAVLVNVADNSSGRKTVLKLHLGETYIGKIEILTTGQQIAFAGRHRFGQSIGWYQLGNPDVILPVPPIEGLSKVNSFDKVVTAAKRAMGMLSVSGITWEINSSATTTGSTADAADLAPEWLTVDRMVDVFGQMQNPASINYDTYKDIGLAAGATLKGIEHHHGTLTPEQENRMADTWATWALKHPDPDHCGMWDSERSKWTGDFRPNGNQNGYRPAAEPHDTARRAVG